MMRSAWKASTSTSCWPASEAAEKSPASVGMRKKRRLRPPVRANAMPLFFRNVFRS